MAISYATEETYETLTAEGCVIVDFFSTTCVPCKMLSATLENLDAEIPFLNIVKVNTTEYPALGEKHKIQAVPTILFLKDGTQMERHVGVMSQEQLKETVSKYLY